MSVLNLAGYWSGRGKAEIPKIRLLINRYN